MASPEYRVPAFLQLLTFDSMAAPDDKKNEAICLEAIGEDLDATLTLDHSKIDSYGLVKSRYDELSIPRTLWVFKRVVLVSLAVYTGYVCEGFELNAGGSVIANAGFIKQFGNHEEAGVRALDPTWVSTWSALLNVGQLVTFTYIWWFADRFGRKASFYVAWVWLVVGCVLLNTAKTPSTWALAKLCNGAGIGVLQIVCQVYVMEITPNRIRGGMVTFQQVWSNIGGIVVAIMMQQLNKKHPDNYLLAMRILWAPIGLMIIFWTFIPESPWYHARRGEKEKAMKCLRMLFGGVEGYDFEEEYGIIVRTIEHEQAINQEKPSFRDVFRGVNLVSDNHFNICASTTDANKAVTTLQKRTLICIVLSCATQLCGLAIINTYSTCKYTVCPWNTLWLIVPYRLLLTRWSGRPISGTAHPEVRLNSQQHALRTRLTLHSLQLRESPGCSYVVSIH